jgi:hypothetical protein
MRRDRWTRRLFGALSLLLAATAPASAQLRPLEPFEWRMFEGGRTVSAQVGGGWLRDQRASLAGTEGTLLEAGNWRAFWRMGRVVLNRRCGRRTTASGATRATTASSPPCA